MEELRLVIALPFFSCENHPTTQSYPSILSPASTILTPTIATDFTRPARLRHQYRISACNKRPRVLPQRASQLCRRSPDFNFHHNTLSTSTAGMESTLSPSYHSVSRHSSIDGLHSPLESGDDRLLRMTPLPTFSHLALTR
jgi:hypothetical protein